MRNHGRPILGAIAGFFFGLFLAADLAQWSVRPLDNISVIGFPIIGAVLGIALGLWAPLGRGRSAGTARMAPATVPPSSSETEPMSETSGSEDEG